MANLKEIADRLPDEPNKLSANEKIQILDQLTSEFELNKIDQLILTLKLIKNELNAIEKVAKENGIKTDFLNAYMYDAYWKSFVDNDSNTWPVNNNREYFIIVNEFDSSLSIVRAKWEPSQNGSWDENSWIVLEANYKVYSIASRIPVSLVKGYIPVTNCIYKVDGYPGYLPKNLELISPRMKEKGLDWYNVHVWDKLEHRYNAPAYPYYIPMDCRERSIINEKINKILQGGRNNQEP